MQQNQCVNLMRPCWKPPWIEAPHNIEPLVAAHLPPSVQFARIFSFSSGSSHHLVRTTSSEVQCSEMSSCEWSACIFCACIVRLQCWQVDNKPGQVEKNPDQGSQFASLELGYHMRTPPITAHTQCTHPVTNLHAHKHIHWFCCSVNVWSTMW